MTTRAQRGLEFLVFVPLQPIKPAFGFTWLACPMFPSNFAHSTVAIIAPSRALIICFKTASCWESTCQVDLNHTFQGSSSVILSISVSWKWSPALLTEHRQNYRFCNHLIFLTQHLQSLKHHLKISYFDTIVWKLKPAILLYTRLFKTISALVEGQNLSNNLRSYHDLEKTCYRHFCLCKLHLFYSCFPVVFCGRRGSLVF